MWGGVPCFAMVTVVVTVTHAVPISTGHHYVLLPLCRHIFSVNMNGSVTALDLDLEVSLVGGGCGLWY